MATLPPLSSFVSSQAPTLVPPTNTPAQPSLDTFTAPDTTAAPATPSYWDNLKNSFMNGINQIKSGFTQTQNGANSKSLSSGAYNLISGAGQEAAGGINTILAPLSAGQKYLADSPVAGTGGNVGDFLNKTIIDPIANSIASHPLIQQMVMKYPGITEDLPNLLTIGATLAGGKEAPEITDAAKGAVDTTVGAAKSAVNTVKAVPGAIVDKAVDVAAPVVNKLSDMATPLDARIQNMIETATPAEAKNLANTLKTYLDQARTATKTNSATPYETAGITQIKAALTALKNPTGTPGLLDVAGKAMNDELAKNGALSVDHTAAESTLNNLMQERLGSIHGDSLSPSKFSSLKESMDFIKGLDQNTKGISATNEEPVSGNIYDAPGRTSRIQTATDRNLVDAAYNTLNRIKDGKNSLSEVQDEISNLQNKLEAAKGIGPKPISTPTQSVVSQFVHQLNDAAKTTGGEAFAKAKATYGPLKEMYDELNNKVGDNYKNAASVAKQAFSPVSSTRNLLERVQNATGVPIFDHLNMAKFAMEVAHDPRVASLLDQTLKNAKSVGALDITKPGTWLKFIQDRFSNPEGKVLRQLENKAKTK